MSQLAATESTAQAIPPARVLPQLVWYFLRLGTWGFGGPIALAGYMQRDLVEEKRHCVCAEPTIRLCVHSQSARGQEPRRSMNG